MQGGMEKRPRDDDEGPSERPSKRPTITYIDEEGDEVTFDWNFFLDPRMPLEVKHHMLTLGIHPRDLKTVCEVAQTNASMVDFIRGVCESPRFWKFKFDTHFGATYGVERLDKDSTDWRYWKGVFNEAFYNTESTLPTLVVYLKKTKGLPDDEFLWRLKQLATSGINLNVQNTWKVGERVMTATALMILSYWENYEGVVTLLRAKARVNEKNDHGSTALMFAAQVAAKSIVAQLLHAGANVDEQNALGSTALIFTSTHPRGMETAQLLTRNGADVDVQTNQGHTALMEASRTGNEALVSILIHNGAQLELKTEKGLTALHIAVKELNVDLSRYLIRQGADVDVKETRGITPLMMSSNFDILEVSQDLIRAGASVDAVDNNDKTALHYAAQKGLVDTVKLLLRNGAYVNHVDKYWHTPLIYASSLLHVEVVKVLLRSGASTKTQSKRGITAIDFAGRGIKPEDRTEPDYSSKVAEIKRLIAAKQEQEVTLFLKSRVHGDTMDDLLHPAASSRLEEWLE